MNLFTPVPIRYERIKPLDAETVLLITVWPGQKVAARIRRVRLDELTITNRGIEYEYANS